ncbi:hypothetical protein DFH06DRAFT_1308993 [Mycena polygramma]|nr:hypothetical protein DFH06DRAFT_1308993 [Mycena polygramma]
MRRKSWFDAAGGRQLDDQAWAPLTAMHSADDKSTRIVAPSLHVAPQRPPGERKNHTATTAVRRSPVHSAKKAAQKKAGINAQGDLHFSPVRSPYNVRARHPSLVKRRGCRICIWGRTAGTDEGKQDDGSNGTHRCPTTDGYTQAGKCLSVAEPSGAPRPTIDVLRPQQSLDTPSAPPPSLILPHAATAVAASRCAAPRKHLHAHSIRAAWPSTTAPAVHEPFAHHPPRASAPAYPTSKLPFRGQSAPPALRTLTAAALLALNVLQRSTSPLAPLARLRRGEIGRQQEGNGGDPSPGAETQASHRPLSLRSSFFSASSASIPSRRHTERDNFEKVFGTHTGLKRWASNQELQAHKGRKGALLRGPELRDCVPSTSIVVRKPVHQPCRQGVARGGASRKRTVESDTPGQRAARERFGGNDGGNAAGWLSPKCRDASRLAFAARRASSENLRTVLTVLLTELLVGLIYCPLGPDPRIQLNRAEQLDSDAATPNETLGCQTVDSVVPTNIVVCTSTNACISTAGALTDQP